VEASLPDPAAAFPVAAFLRLRAMTAAMTAAAATESTAAMPVFAAVKVLSDSSLLLLSSTSSSPMPTSVSFDPKVVALVISVAFGAIVALTGAATGAATGGSGSGQVGTGAAIGVLTGGRTGGVIKGKLNDMLRLATDPTPKRPRRDLNWIAVSRIVGSTASQQYHNGTTYACISSSKSERIVSLARSEGAATRAKPIRAP
jgi:hypothetical protein